jgi:hypothetical protein
VTIYQHLDGTWSMLMKHAAEGGNVWLRR